MRGKSIALAIAILASVALSRQVVVGSSDSLRVAIRDAIAGDTIRPGALGSRRRPAERLRRAVVG